MKNREKYYAMHNKTVSLGQGKMRKVMERKVILPIGGTRWPWVALPILCQKKQKA